MPSPRRIVLASACLALLAALPTRAAPRRDTGHYGPASGTITISARGAAAGVGYTWGDGVLRYGGHKYPFTVNGVTVADVGFSRVNGRGRVYNLRRLQDFTGTYVAATGEATLGNGIGGQVLRNGNGVEIRVDEVTHGARLQGSADGIRLTLK
ncbi:MAG: hypothetical protein JOZ05_18055 [Acetobacteraceae bacterium]|nr:hypothetical protein [Acetobacteraceae bacterium]